MISELKVGPSVNQDGAQITQRAGKDGATIVQDAHSKYQEAVYRGNVYLAANQATQAVTVLGATMTGLILYNPVNSGKNLVVFDCGGGLTTALTTATQDAVFILGAGPGPNVAAPTGVTALTPVNALLNTGNPVAKVYSTATFAAAPVAVKALAAIGGATAAGFFFAPVVSNNIDGSIIIIPGSFLCVASTVALSYLSHVVWEEIVI